LEKIKKLIKEKCIQVIKELAFQITLTTIKITLTTIKITLTKIKINKFK
jgi:hypothetical protein